MMEGQQVVVCKRLWKRLRKTTEVFRTLYGLVVGRGQLHITGTTLQRLSLPYGQPAIGIYCSKSSDTESLLAQCQKRVNVIQEALSIIEAPHFVLLINDCGELVARLIGADTTSEMEATVVLSDFEECSGVVLRTRLAIPLSVEYCGAEGQFRETLTQAIAANCKWLVAENVAFELNGELSKFDQDSTLGEFLRKALRRKNEPEGVDMRELRPVRILGSDDDSARGDSYHSPVIHIQRGNSKVFDFSLALDVVSVFSYETEMRKVSNLLTNALQQQTATSVEVICSSILENQLTPPAPMHFNVDNGLATILYPRNIVSQAVKVATQMDLAVKSDKPIFCSGQSIFFAQDSPVYGSLLMNPHSKLKLPPKTTTVGLIRGNYLYFHYMQQKFDDAGWGCAYRSLQTLCSWLRLQGFTEEDVPDHRKIQETLVTIGDKESSFIGSKQWIGSQEVSFVLNLLMRIETRTIFVTSGAEVAMRSGELYDHFDTQGTPIMIGGGQLAHTILGVAINDSTNETYFLVLDPHYTGSEDLQTITAKGWCSWKPSTFWDASSFYNMCLPMLPS